MAKFKVKRINGEIVLVEHSGLEILREGETYEIDTEEYFKVVNKEKM